MKKVKNILLLLTAIFTLGCSQTIVFEDIQTPTPTPTPKPEPDLDTSSYIDLSAEGTANCYLVKAAGTYKFKAVKGNSAQSVGAASSATVLWESFGTSTKPNEGDLIASATYKDGYVYFATPTTFKSGNASIAVRDSNAKILWSWHIWLSKEGWKDDVYPNNAGTMMDRNLGATSATPGSVGALGLLYQWGRKDPFLGSRSISSIALAVSTGSWNSVSTQQTVDYVTANPMTFVCGYSEWCTGDGAEDSNYAKRWTESTKSMYDPCPVGYRVPKGGNDGFWATALGTSNSTSAGTTWDSTNNGRQWTLADRTTAAWYPAVGCRYDNGGALSKVGSYGYCWSASSDPSRSDCAYYLRFDSGYVYPASSSSRGDGYSVRCVSTTATSNPNPEPEPTKGYIVPENAKRVTFEIDGSLEAYTNVADQFNIADLVKGANTNATVQMAYLNDNDLLAWQDWTITDGWFGLNGATSWGNGNIACVKPKTDGSFEYVGLMDGQAIGTKATAIFDYGNDIIVAITVEIVAPEVSNVIYSENCGSTISKVDGYWPYVDMYTGWSRQGGNGCDQSGVTYTGVNASVRDNGAEYKPDSGANYASDAPYAYISYKTNSNFGINNIKIDSSTKSYSLSFTAHNQYACLISSPYTPATTPLKSGEHVKLYVSVDGQNWGVVQFATVANGNWEYATAPFTLPTNADTLHIKFADLSIGTLSLPSTEYQHIASLRLDDFCLTKGGNGPTLNFDYTFGEQPTPEPTEPANNEIWYTSTDGAVIAHHSGSVSGANIVSNTYTNGKGVLTFDGNVTKILSYLFSAQSKLKSIVLPNSVTHIYTQAFGNCYNLVDVDLGSGLTYIGNAAFDACSALTSITIPDSVTFIGPAPFLACYNLANFYGAAATDDHKGLVIDNTFVSFAPAGPTEYSIPHGVTVIQDGSFNDCQKITKVTIPATVVEIEEQAFYRCYALSVVNCLPTTPPTLLMHSSYGTFDSNASDRKIYVPASSVSAYKSASGWSTYADAIVADPASEPTPEITSAPYAVGDYYNDGTKEGVVFEVSADGTSGKIVSMMQSTGTLQWSSDRTEQERLIGADSETDGAYNTAKVKAISGWETKYPAFKWCADLGDGWYLPAKEELLTIYNNKDKLNTNLTDKLSSFCWSSTEYDEQYDGKFCAWYVGMYDGGTYLYNKDGNGCVRAVSAF